MKKLLIISLIGIITIYGKAQEESTKHFEADLMVGMHHYSSSYFHAINSITWVQKPPVNYTEFSGYGTSILPSVQVSYFFSNNIGIAAGLTAITAENDLYVDDTTGTNYDYCTDQFNINLGISGRVDFRDSPISLNMGSGLIIAPFDISQSIESNTGGSYMYGNDSGVGFYGNASFQIKIISFLRFKTQLSYSFIPASITLYDTDGNVEKNIKNLNTGGITLKTGLSVQL